MVGGREPAGTQRNVGATVGPGGTATGGDLPPAPWGRGAVPMAGRSAPPNNALEPTAPKGSGCPCGWRSMGAAAHRCPLGPTGVRQTSKTGRHHSHPTTETGHARDGHDSKQRQAKTDGQDSGQRRTRQTPETVSDRPSRTARPPPCPGSPARGPRAWVGTGPGRVAVRGLTNACKRRATAYAFGQTGVCTVWPAPEAWR